MYTRKEVLRGKFAIKAETPEEAIKIDRLMGKMDAAPWWNTYHEETCFIPSEDVVSNIRACTENGYTLIPLSSISDLSEQSGEGVRGYGVTQADIDAIFTGSDSPWEELQKVHAACKTLETFTDKNQALGFIEVMRKNVGKTLEKQPPTPIGRDIGEIRSLPFDWSLLQNTLWLPEESGKAYMGKAYDEAIEEYNKAESKVLYNGIYLQWDSCDCGDGYGCSHGSWVYEAHMHNVDGKPFLSTEDDGIRIEGRNTVFIEDFSKITIGDFEDACRIAGVQLDRKFTPSPVSELSEERTPYGYKVSDQWKHMSNIAYEIAFGKDGFFFFGKEWDIKHGFQPHDKLIKAGVMHWFTPVYK